MLLVIVGAGASFDSIPSRPPRKSDLEPYRPPLADELFQSRTGFEEVQRAIPQVMQIAPSLLHRQKGESVEDILGTYASEAASYPLGMSQLAAVRFYLQGIITQCEDGWYRTKPIPTNLVALIDQIERKRRDRQRPIFVTFNYDRLIENALENRGQPFGSMNHYIAPNGIRLFKLHGSVDWMRRIGQLDAPRFGGPAWTIAKQICDQIQTLQPVGPVEYRPGLVPTSNWEGQLAIPAISIPVKEKSEFECPESHKDALVTALKDVKTILTIGWRGAERHFLKLLNDSGMQRVDGTCVAGGPGEAEETIANLQKAGIAGHFVAHNDGFSHFVSTRSVERLLNLTWT